MFKQPQMCLKSRFPSGICWNLAKCALAKHLSCTHFRVGHGLLWCARKSYLQQQGSFLQKLALSLKVIKLSFKSISVVWNKSSGDPPTYQLQNDHLRMKHNQSALETPRLTFPALQNIPNVAYRLPEGTVESVTPMTYS